MSMPALDSTYGAWLVALFVETILYGIGILQTWLYFQWWPKDGWDIKAPVIIVMFFETVQILFFFRSSYVRFVVRFGVLTTELLWSDSLQLLANYLTAFAVQLYFASQIYRLMREGVRLHNISKLGIYIVVLLAILSVGAGTAQTILSYKLRSYAKLDQTKAVTTFQSATALACDSVITVFLCFYLQRHKSGMQRTERVLRSLMINAVNRGMLTSLSSACTMILFLAFPGTFWFFLSLAPNSKLYMNSMLATLNMRLHMRNKLFPPEHEWDTVHLGGLSGSGSGRRHSVSAVEFVRPPNAMGDLIDDTEVEMEADAKSKKALSFPSCDTVTDGK